MSADAGRKRPRDIHEDVSGAGHPQPAFIDATGPPPRLHCGIRQASNWDGNPDEVELHLITVAGITVSDKLEFAFAAVRNGASAAPVPCGTDFVEVRLCGVHCTLHAALRHLCHGGGGWRYWQRRVGAAANVNPAACLLKLANRQAGDADTRGVRHKRVTIFCSNHVLPDSFPAPPRHSRSQRCAAFAA
jgi:hypothetical protein